VFFKVVSNDTRSRARVCEIQTGNGIFQTPIFMPVGTQGAVKAVEHRELIETGAKIVLGNTYHLYLRPGMDVLSKAGGLHKFMNWNLPILTDSGGFQVFSLSALRKVGIDGVEFRSHIDGTTHIFTPEKVVNFQRVIGSDIMMTLDECLENPTEYSKVEESVKLTTEWAKKSKTEFKSTEPNYDFKQFHFGIVQGSVFKDLRKRSAEEIAELDFDGNAIGGLAVGEENEMMYDIVNYVTDFLPTDKPRYLMGVGTPEDLLNAVEMGVDMFDCVLPTRNARNSTLFTSKGKLRLRNAENKFKFEEIDEWTDSYASNFTVAYLRHLFMSDEILGAQLASIHNVRFFLKLMEQIRQAIIEDRFVEYKKSFLDKYNSNL